MTTSCIEHSSVGTTNVRELLQVCTIQSIRHLSWLSEFLNAGFYGQTPGLLLLRHDPPELIFDSQLVSTKGVASRRSIKVVI